MNVQIVCGEVAKWLNAADCKSAPNGFGSSNLPPSTTLGCSQVVRQQTLTLSFRWFDPSHPSQFDPVAQVVEHLTFNQRVESSILSRVTTSLLGRKPIFYKKDSGKVECRCSSVVELQPSKLTMWVRFPSPAPKLNPSLLRKCFFYTIFHVLKHFMGLLITTNNFFKTTRKVDYTYLTHRNKDHV